MLLYCWLNHCVIAETKWRVSWFFKFAKNDSFPSLFIRVCIKTQAYCLFYPELRLRLLLASDYQWLLEIGLCRWGTKENLRLDHQINNLYTLRKGAAHELILEESLLQHSSLLTISLEIYLSTADKSLIDTKMYSSVDDKKIFLKQMVFLAWSVFCFGKLLWATVYSNNRAGVITTNL